MEEEANEERIQAIKAALWLAVGKIADQTCLEDLQGVTASTNFIAALTDYVWEQSQSLGRDCEAFAKHRNSDVVESKDVLLCTRRNDALQAMAQSWIDEVAKGN